LRPFAAYEIAPSSLFFSAAVCGDPKLQRSHLRMSSSAMADGASWIWSGSMAVSGLHQCRAG